MKLLVTGPRGFIASNLIAELKSKSGYSVLTLDRDLPAAEYPAFFSREKFDAVVHLATLFLKTHAFEQIEPLIESNLTLTTQLLEAASKTGVKQFVTFGTYYEYPSPASLYAATKAAMSPILEYYARTTSLPLTELYLYDSYGPGDTRAKILNHFLKAAATGETLALSPGYQKMKLLHVRDIVAAILHTLALSPSGNDVARYAVEPLESLTLREIASKVEGVVGKKLNAQWGAREYLPGVQMEPSLPHPPLPGWRAQIFLDQGLVEVAKSC